MSIRFGSDGFRGIIGHGFTRDNIARIAKAVVAYLRELGPEDTGTRIPVGYDTRFLSKQAAYFACRVLEHCGHRPVLAHRPCPSPYLAFAVRHLNAPIGLQITASHNPPCYCGIKLKGRHGGSLFPGHADLVEQLANLTDISDLAGLRFLAGGPPVKTFNLDDDYRRAVLAAARWEGRPGRRIIVDFMHGVSAGIYREVLAECLDLDTALHTGSDPMFGGHKPEPQAGLLTELIQRITHDGRDPVGLAFDGDGDRLAVIDETGRYLAPHEIFCLLLEHLAPAADSEDMVITTVSFSGLVEKVAAAHGLLVLDVPVGFKHVSQEMVQNEAIMGGEESGGTGFGHHLPERDALLMALLLIQASEQTGATLHEMVEQLYRTYGRPVFQRRDIHLAADIDHDELVSRIRDLASLERVAGDLVQGLNHRDGMKLKTAAGWVLVRPSGTEPLLRVYSEGQTAAVAQAYAEAIIKELGLPNA